MCKIIQTQNHNLRYIFLVPAFIRIYKGFLKLSGDGFESSLDCCSLVGFNGKAIDPSKNPLKLQPIPNYCQDLCCHARVAIKPGNGGRQSDNDKDL